MESRVKSHSQKGEIEDREDIESREGATQDSEKMESQQDRDGTTKGTLPGTYCIQRASDFHLAHYLIELRALNSISRPKHYL